MKKCIKAFINGFCNGFVGMTFILSGLATIVIGMLMSANATINDLTTK